MRMPLLSELELQKLRRSENFWRAELHIAEKAMIHAHGEFGQVKAWERVTNAGEQLSRAVENLRKGAA